MGGVDIARRGVTVASDTLQGRTFFLLSFEVKSKAETNDIEVTTATATISSKDTVPVSVSSDNAIPGEFDSFSSDDAVSGGLFAIPTMIPFLGTYLYLFGQFEFRRRIFSVENGSRGDPIPMRQC